MENEFIAQFEAGEQITEDHWRLTRPTLKVTDKTTVKEIFDWFRNHQKQGDMEVKIIQTQCIKLLTTKTN